MTKGMIPLDINFFMNLSLLIVIKMRGKWIFKKMN